VASKSFGTSETLRNYESAREWLKSTLSKETSLKNQFIAITANNAKANATGIEKENILRIPDWVGGRYSVWSAMGMPIALKYGYDVYVDFLSGAATVDSHFKTAPLERNLPVILGMVGIWNTNFLKSASLAIIPYEHRLSSLPMYLQQLEMESNGKSISLDGTTIDYHSAPVTWGASGTDAQHSFCQLLHQGTHQIPVDFILALKAAPGYEKHQDMLVANCLAQSRALMLGNERQNNIEDYKKLRGDRPSSLIYMDELNPKTLGALISLYEHKTFVQSAVWNINPFDQWGVELGKAFASSIIDDIDSETSCNQSDPSTTAILARYKALKTGRST
jgi:glucose-6-phosphate isomerase